MSKNKSNFLRNFKLKQRNKINEHKGYLWGKTYWAQQEETTLITKYFKLNSSLVE